MTEFSWEEQAGRAIEQLLLFAVRKGLVETVDVPYCRNLLLDAMGMQAPGASGAEDTGAETAGAILQTLCELAVKRQLIGPLSVDRELFSVRLMGLLTPSPAEVRRRYRQDLAEGGPERAVTRFYEMCRACDYIKVDAIAQNLLFLEDTPAGQLEITINLSKPEKDPREIAKLKNAPSVGYPLCMLCVENPGYAGRANFPARQNHRMVPLTLGGQSWYLQYSPYAYYPEHCIVLNSRHIPMKIDRGTFVRLFDFVGQVPHYFLGSNADLPIVGGSILNHDHFQGGNHIFPMDKAGLRTRLAAPAAGVTAGIVDWPMTAVRLESEDAETLIRLADDMLQAWRGWSDEALGILAASEGVPHNTITPILRRKADRWCLTLVLRNNRTSGEHPLGIFHPHAELHHIKRENIGLIEVMGLFILPGRLKTELAQLTPWLTGAEPLAEPEEADPRYKHYPWVCEILRRHGPCADAAAAEALLHHELGTVCARVLADAGVYKADAAGQAGLLRFLAAQGYREGV